MYWTLLKMIEKIRQLTGRPSVNQMSNQAVVDSLNEFYRDFLHTHVEDVILECQMQANLDNTANADRLVIVPSQDFVDFFGPFTIDGAPLRVYRQRELFEAAYPLSEELPRGTPESILIADGTITFAPAPAVGDNPLFLCSGRRKPDVLADDTYTPIRVDWGRLIVVGTAILILSDSNQHEEAKTLQPMFMDAKRSINVDFYRSLSNTRSAPSF